MFRIFSRFNALFVRPHIRGAIREYQNQLIHRVKEDIEKLHEKFKVQYADSRAAVLSLGKLKWLLKESFYLAQFHLINLRCLWEYF